MASFCGQIAQASGTPLPQYVKLMRSRWTRSSWLLSSSARTTGRCRATSPDQPIIVRAAGA